MLVWKPWKSIFLGLRHMLNTGLLQSTPYFLSLCPPHRMLWWAGHTTPEEEAGHDAQVGCHGCPAWWATLLVASSPKWGPHTASSCSAQLQTLALGSVWVARSLPAGGCLCPRRILPSSNKNLPRENKQTKKPQPLCLLVRMKMTPEFAKKLVFK